MAEINIYLIVALNGFVSGLGGAAGAWVYNTFIKRHADKLHKKISPRKGGGKQHG